MFGEIFPEVDDLTQDGVCVCVSMCVFKLPSTAKVIWSQCHGLKSHLTTLRNPLTILEKHLKSNSCNFDSSTIVSRSCKSHIHWRIDNLEVRFKLISHGKPTLTAPRQVGAYDKTKTSIQGNIGQTKNRKTTIMF